MNTPNEATQTAAPSLAVFLRQNMREYGILIALVVIMVFFQIITGGVLFRPVNLTNLVLQNSFVVIMAPAASPVRNAWHSAWMAARLVASGECRLGIILCGTGQGIMMAANKVKGVRCGVCSDTFSARMIRQHNDANMLSIGARVVGEGLALDIVDAFLSAQFEGGRHATRVEMIEALEG